ncbi:MAG TPA: hypothetical protein DCZ03_00550 [Gammaproteobacteria bacterium]|nr:hypothetical protein [Gammaproteobacteria bacterium]
MLYANDEIVDDTVRHFEAHGVALEKQLSRTSISYKFMPVPIYKLEMILKKAHRTLRLEEKRDINFPREEDGAYYLYKIIGRNKMEISIHPQERSLQFKRI